MRKSFKHVVVAGAAASVLMVPLLATPASAATTPTVVTSGLNNPRQLSMTSDGVLLVAEAGKGGTSCTGEGEQQMCVGTSGSVSAVFHPANANAVNPIRVVTGLISGSGPDGSFAIGSDGVSAKKFLGGTIFMQETFAPPDVFPAGIPGEQSGKLLYAWPGYTPKIASDVSAYELTLDPDGKGVDSNPYAVLDLGDRRLVADAAGNSILSVAANGKITLFKVFKNITTGTCGVPNPATNWPGYDPSPEFPGCHFVPTSLALANDGDILVGGLASEQPGQAQVVKLDAKTGAVKKTWTGFTGVTGVAMGKDGSLYVSEFFAPQANGPTPESIGVVTKVSPSGARVHKDVPFPTGIVVDSSNNVYVSAFSVASDAGMPGSPAEVNTSGQVWRFKF